MPTPDLIRLLLVDDHTVVRMGLSAVLSLEADLSVVAEAEDGAEAVECFEKTSPDVVLMDVRMPGMDGVAAVEAIRGRWNAARILMLTTSELDVDVHRAMAAGASGYLLKSVSREELVSAIRQVHGGGCYLPATMERRLAALASRKHLSAREIEVLDGMRRGLSNRDIALSLSISENTVKAHVKAILLKLESADRAEAVARGFEQGVLRLDAR